MQITLCEDDGIFFDGVPRNVILLVKFDDGKQIRVPYSAEKSISAMYEDLSRIAPKSNEFPFLKEKFEVAADTTRQRAAEALSQPKKSNVIEKEDVVTLVKLEDRGDGASVDLQIGREYRVLKVIATGVTLPGSDSITQLVNGYDIIDDASARPERIRVMPHEVALARKRIPPPPIAESKIEEILPCPNCRSMNALALEGSAFEGTCQDCKCPIKIERIIKQCNTNQCSNDVALFDNGQLFKGVCTKCKKAMEVEYA